MFSIPKDPKKIKERIRRYERALKKEKEEHGFYDDSAGKRYLLGPLYLYLGDIEGAVKSYKWFEKEFPDDSGLPFNLLCWALVLYRSGDKKVAKKKLLQTMFSNLYLIPYLIGIDLPELDIRHGSNWQWKEYVYSVPDEFIELWDDIALKWAENIYYDQEIKHIRQKYIEIKMKLKDEHNFQERGKLIDEAQKLEDIATFC